MTKKNKEKEKEQELPRDQAAEEEQTAHQAEHTAEEPKQEAANAPDPMEELQKQNDELKDQLLRKIAEFDNFRKRTQREKQELYGTATADCIVSLLGVVDNFERALSSDCSDETFKKGMEMIFKQMTDSLEKLGVKEIEAQGKPFDPNFHSAVNQVEDENFGENTVCQVFQKGYMLGDKVIRHAMVVVANP